MLLTILSPETLTGCQNLDTSVILVCIKANNLHCHNHVLLSGHSADTGPFYFSIVWYSPSMIFVKWRMVRSQLLTQFTQFRKRSLNKKFKTSTGFDTGAMLNPVELLNFFSSFLRNCIIYIAFTTARIILHLISFPQFLYDLFHIHH